MFDWRSLIEDKKIFLLEYKRFENIPLLDILNDDDDTLISHSLPKSTISDDWSEDEVNEMMEKKDERLLFLHDDIRNMKEFIIKINETSPKDSLWISTEHSLRCTSLDDSIIMLKSSNRITFSIPSSLTIIKWNSSIKLCNEFRCFIDYNTINNPILIAISQKDDSVFYKHLLYRKEEIIEKIKEKLIEIFKNFKPNQYVLDLCFLDDNDNDKNIVIIDIGEWRMNSGILWEWDELENLQNLQIFNQIRLVESEGDCRVGSARLNCYDNFM